MPHFKHHPSGRIWIDEERIPLTEFMIEEPTYSLPENAIGRFYDGTVHRLFSNNKEWKGPVPWIDGDSFILKKQTYIDNIAVRNFVPEPSPLTSSERINIITNGSDTAIVVFKLLFKLHNRVLALESKPPVTVSEFLTFLEGELS